MPSFGHLSVQIWIRPFSSPGTPSQSYGRFASKWLHLDTFLSRSGSGNVRDVRLLFWSNSICAKWTFLTTYRYAQMRSRSTPVGPNRRRQLKMFVLSTEINFEAFLEAISESGRCKKYLFHRAKKVAPPATTTHPHPQRARLKHFDARISSFTERNENIPTCPQWRVFDLK